MKKYALSLGLTVIALSLYACKNKEHHHAQEDSYYYTCSMHPQVISDAPGACPICHMDLVRVSKGDSQDPNSLQLSNEQIQLGNIQTETVEKKPFGDKLILTGTLNFNQRDIRSVSARVMGRIEKLYYKNVGDYVEKGLPLIELYSESLNNAKQEYVLAVRRKNDFLGKTTSIDFEQLLQSAKNKLLLWGMTETQIERLAQEKEISPTTTFYSTEAGYITLLPVPEGGYVGEGETIVTLASLATLWAEAQAYSSQLSIINRTSIATVQIPDVENQIIAGRIEFTNPELNPSTRINLVRVSIPNPHHTLKPGMPVYVFLETPKTHSLTMPVDAVIRNGTHATVWVKTGTNTFKSQMVKTGLEADNRIEIIAGLKDGDVVVVSGTYLLNSEFIFKNGTDPMAGHDMSKM